MTTGERPPSSVDAIAGARLALENAERLRQAARRLERPPDALGAAAALYATAIEEAAKATGWAFYALTPETSRTTAAARRAMAAITGKHRSKLAIASFTDAANRPIAIGLVGLLLLLAWVLKKERPTIDEGALLQLIERPPPGALGRYEHVWDMRQHGLYVDWDSDRWNSPRQLARTQVAEVRELSREAVDQATSFRDEGKRKLGNKITDHLVAEGCTWLRPRRRCRSSLEDVAHAWSGGPARAQPMALTSRLTQRLIIRAWDER
jgi:AbiV family abortive infection protein